MHPKHWLIASYVAAIIFSAVVSITFDDGLIYAMAAAGLFIFLLPYIPLIHIRSRFAAWIFAALSALVALVASTYL